MKRSADRKEFAEALTHFRKEVLHLTGEAMAEKLGVKPSAYRNWENGYSEPKDWTVKQRLQELGFDCSVPSSFVDNDRISIELAEVLLNLIENPDSSPEDKRVAKQTILNAIRRS